MKLMLRENLLNYRNIVVEIGGTTLTDEGAYWVRPNEADPWEVALYCDDAWWFHGIEEGAEGVDVIGPSVLPPPE